MTIGAQFTVRIDVGVEDLYVAGLRGVDRISELFRYEIDVVGDLNVSGTQSATFDLEGLVGTPCHLTFDDGSAQTHVHGFVSRVQRGDKDSRFVKYRITMVPRISKLTHKAACRIFLEADARKIATEILGEHGFSKGTDFDFRLSEDPVARPYCVQYRETDWDFINRILLEDGIFGFFVHDDSKEMLVFGAERDVHPAISGDPTLPFRDRTKATSEAEYISAFNLSEALTSGAVTLREWNFEQPDLTGDKHFEVEKKVTKGKSPTALEIYDYPGQYPAATPGGAARAKIRLEQLQAGKRVAQAESNSHRMMAGHSFSLSEHYEFNGKYVLLEVYHRVSSDPSDIGHHDTAHNYRSELVVQPADVPVRPAPRGPKPRIPGVQTALVVGPKGEEIHTDERGRVLLKFHWDRDPDREAPTAWVRVAQMWGSGPYGAYFIPRMDQEVVVAYEDGDPDRPLVVGTVYHEAIPIALPANKTQSVIKTQSTPKGAGKNNELRFEDKKDEEQIYVHAQKDVVVVTENDVTSLTKHDEEWTIGNDRVTDVARDDTVTIGRHQKIQIDGNLTLDVAGTSAVAVTKASTVTLSDTSSVDITKASTVKVGGTSSVEVTKAFDLKVSDAGSATFVKALKVKAKAIAIEAEDELSIKVGKATLVMKKNGDITLTGGGKIVVEATGDMNVESKKSLSLKGGKDVKAEASSNLVLKGSKVAGN